MKAIKTKIFERELGFHFVLHLTLFAFVKLSVTLLVLSLVFHVASFVVQNSYSPHFFP